MKQIALQEVQQVGRYRDGKVSIRFLDAHGEQWDIEADPDEVRALAVLLKEAVEKLEDDSS